ncbi:transmembrane protein, putative [Medicago truncatula]|uniref:Transmembrane protein, putative n=1 Tax=Medicago truncatula TaxID=3880 RepID=A0A072TXK9_MEDTR|nr:transmembrane protein, putative [Medicago truncatula]
MFGLTVRMENRGCTKILLKSFGLEMKNLLIFMRRDLVMLVIFILCLEGLRTVVMH